MIKRTLPFSKYPALFLLILITTVAYGRSLSHQFVWDDEPIIIENPYIRNIGNIPSFFFPYYWKYNHPGTKGQYRPLRTVSLAISYRLWKFRPFGYHLTNLILHILNVLLVYLVVMKLFKKPKIAFLTSLLFALHPIHVEAVSWVKNRTELFSLAFFLLSLSFYIKYIPVPDGSNLTSNSVRQNKWLILSSLCFILALMGKETAIALPIVLFAYLLYFHPYPENKLSYPSLLPFLGITIFYLFFIFIIINKGLPSDPNEIRLHSDIHVFLITQTLSSYLSMILMPIKLNAERLMDIPLFLLNPSLLFSLSLLVLIFAIIQLSPILVLGPVAAWVFSTSQTLPAVLFLIWIILVGLSDNFLKPLLMGRGVDIPMLVILIMIRSAMWTMMGISTSSISS